MQIDWESLSVEEREQLQAFIAKKGRLVGAAWNKMGQLSRMAMNSQNPLEIQLIEQELARLGGDFSREAEAVRQHRNQLP